MKHIPEGDIRAYLDQQLTPERQEAIRAHLGRCTACQERLDEVAGRARWIDHRLAPLDSPPHRHIYPSAARARLETYTSQNHKEQVPMLNRIFSRKTRPLWAAITAVVVLAALLMVPSVQAIANSFLDLFRVQQITVLPVDISSLPSGLGRSTQFKSVFNEDVQFQENGKAQPVADAAAAEKAAGFNVRLPAALGAPQKLEVQPGANFSFKIDVNRLQAILDEIGRSDLKLPKDIDGKVVTADIQPQVVARYGDCTSLSKSLDPTDPDMPALKVGANCTMFTTLPSPTVSAPDGIDMQQLGEIFLQLTGMSAENARQYAASVDWSSTLILPIPINQATYQDVTVVGVKGTLIQEKSSRNPQYILVWVKDGLLYGLTGPGDGSQALDTAASLK